MQKEEDFGGVGVAFCEGEQVEVVVADVEILSSRSRETLADRFTTSIARPCRETYIYPLV